MKRLIFVLLALVGFAIAGDAQGMWIKSRTQGDKVEQTNGSDVFYYRDNDVELMINVSKRTIFLVPLIAHDWVFEVEKKNRNVSLAISTLATFDLKNNRTGYYNNIVAMQSPDHSALIFCDEIQLVGENNFGKIWDYLLTSSGSVVFRLQDLYKGYVDYEIKTIKTLGYENTINGKHVDGDVDVLGL